MPTRRSIISLSSGDPSDDREAKEDQGANHNQSKAGRCFTDTTSTWMATANGEGHERNSQAEQTERPCVRRSGASTYEEEASCQERQPKAHCHGSPKGRFRIDQGE